MMVHQGQHAKHKVQVFRNGKSRSIRIPKEFEFEVESAVIQKLPDGDILIRQAETVGLVDYLETVKPWEGDDFLVGIDDLEPVDTVKF